MTELEQCETEIKAVLKKYNRKLIFSYDPMFNLFSLMLVRRYGITKKPLILFEKFRNWGEYK